MVSDAVKNIIQKLQLQPHPEGGFYRETYRSQGVIPEDVLGAPFDGPRNYATAIYYLITSENFSAFHKVNQDETWHYYKGSAMLLHIISPNGNYRQVTIGNDFDFGQLPQYTVLAGHWFASEVARASDFSLMGCTVAPGFDFADFELANRTRLIDQFPQHSEIIKKLTRN